jgi:hypothetical protein
MSATELPEVRMLDVIENPFAYIHTSPSFLTWEPIVTEVNSFITI